MVDDRRHRREMAEFACHREKYTQNINVYSFDAISNA